MPDDVALDLLASAHRPAVILAGGKSTRFGSDKASALLRGEPLLAWVGAAAAHACDALVVVRAAGQRLPLVSVPVPVAIVEDELFERGPLAGLAAAFARVVAPVAFVTSCDAPLLQPDLVRLLFAAVTTQDDAVVPRLGDVPQPLAAVYRPAACLPIFEAALARGEGSVRQALVHLSVRFLAEDAVRRADPGLLSFENVNTPAALARLEAILPPGAGPEQRG
ncbi:MAG: molybdenum cofactor guanylyltransferase [Dehalococcoidia bacterium]|nr:molybdenum cofactor guanylyltransferase [Dehalococcoidia bacterium]